jgi:epoxyqueuosine reductase
MDAGADAVGFARAEPVEPQAWQYFSQWLREGCNGSLSYMHNYPELRRDPRLLLDGCKTVVATAWNYNPATLRSPSLPYIARYAYGEDYHKSLRRKLRAACRQIEALCGAKWRVCIDSAPIMERYWAVKSGLGFVGRNGCLIVPGVGSWVVLAEVLLTVELEPDAARNLSCKGCGRCLKACPGGALKRGSSPDARRCLSAISVEGEECPPDLQTRLPLLGCDRCQLCCPHNQNAPHSSSFEPLEAVMRLNAERIFDMSPEKFSEQFSHSSLSRPGLDTLRRNLNLQAEAQLIKSEENRQKAVSELSSQEEPSE